MAIKSAVIKEDKLHVIIEKKGSIPIPVKLTIFEINKPESSIIGTDVIYKTAAVWESGNEEYLIDYNISKVTEGLIIVLGGPEIPDIDKTNNNFSLKGIEP